MRNNNIKNVKPTMVAISFISSFCKGYAAAYAFGTLVNKAKRRKEVRLAK